MLESEHDTAQLHDRIGSIHAERLEVDAALNHYGAALRIKDRIGNLRAFAQTLTNVGVILYTTGELRRALRYFTRAELIFETLGAPDRGLTGPFREAIVRQLGKSEADAIFKIVAAGEYELEAWEETDQPE